MNIFIIDLESVQTRYTCEWKDHIPALLKNEAKRRGRTDVIVENISGGNGNVTATPGAFLNFAVTNIYKNEQLTRVATMFALGQVSPGDQFIFADAWHPGIIQLKYMSELLQVPVTIHALWHAGSYDPQDFLGRLIKDKRWTNKFEQSLFHAIDYNWYATNFHIDMFYENVFPKGAMAREEYDAKALRTGWPMEYMTEMLQPYQGMKKRDLILFPHRIAPEKQPELFRDLAAALPKFEWVICQEQTLTKKEYHTLLGQAKMVLSLNLQETLGISCFEGAITGAIPLVPDRLSYTEMYDSMWKYPEWWAREEYWLRGSRENLIELIEVYMNGHSTWVAEHTQDLAVNLQNKYFSATNLIEKVFNEGNK